MKKYLIIALLSPLFWSCATEETQPEENGELMRLTEEIRSLKSAAGEQDSAMNAVFLTFNEIEDNLSAIYEREGNISQHRLDDVELQDDVKTRIGDEIQAINELMANNKDLSIPHFNQFIQRILTLTSIPG